MESKIMISCRRVLNFNYSTGALRCYSCNEKCPFSNIEETQTCKIAQEKGYTSIGVFVQDKDDPFRYHLMFETGRKG